jgi:PLP dependent protein
MTIAEKLAGIRERMAGAARQAGRSPDEVALMAVSKTHPASAILEAVSAGQRLFGENRVQEFAAKFEELGRANLESAAMFTDSSGAVSAKPKFHLIGHLQSNKAARAVELFDAIDSVDSLRLAERLNAACSNWSPERRLAVLIEINIGAEAEKAGLDPDSAELRALLEARSKLAKLEIRGLMTVPPFTPEAEGARPYFRRLRQLRDQLQASSGVELPELSMGMSHDFEVAIEEGSTCVRVGTAIFGERPPADAKNDGGHE